MAEAAEEQWLPEVEEGAAVGLKATTMVDKLPSNGNSTRIIAANGDDKSSDDEDHPDEKGGALDNIDISGILDFDGNTNGNTETVHEGVAHQLEAGESSGTTEQVVEEEIVELEFENVKLGTHTMHCPNCNHEITKVVLRRRVLITRVSDELPSPDDPKKLVGCCSCLSLFTSSENGGFNPFNIFGKRLDTSNNPPPQPMVREEGNCLSMFWVLKKDEKKPDRKDELATNVNDGSDRPHTPKYVAGNTSIGGGDSGAPSLDPLPPSSIPYSQVSTENEPSGWQSEGGDRYGGPNLHLSGVRQPDTAIDVLPGPGQASVSDEIVAGTEDVRAPATEEGSASLEVLKSIVYGGLMEVIASFSVVASAAASEATALNIIALALASVVGGIFAIGHNLWDLRDDCYKWNSSQETKQEASNKYKALLGRLNYFPLHAVVVILSFVVFGMVPPVAYGFSYRETSDRDYTIVDVAIVSLFCVSLLAIFKAYVTRCKGFFEYVKTVVYYVTTVVSVSGVSYVVGILLSRLIEELGLFDGSSDVATTLFPHGIVPSLASF